MLKIVQKSISHFKAAATTGYNIVLPDGLTERQKEKELQKQAVLFEKEVQDGTYLDGENITFAEFTDKWITEYAEKQLAPKTLYESKKMLEYRILPALGHIRLSKLQPMHILDFYNNLAENGMRLDYLYQLKDSYSSSVKDIEELDKRTMGNVLAGKGVTKTTADKISDITGIPIEKTFTPVNGSKGLSPKTIHNHHGLISSILTSAVQWQVILANPCDRVKPPKKEKKEAQHYDDEQLNIMLEMLKSEPANRQALVYLAIFSGARLGELLGLDWDDINFERQTIKISKSVQYLPGKGIFEKPPKNEHSKRTITVSKFALDVLQHHKAGQELQKEQYGNLWHESDKIFTQSDGGLVSPNNITKWFKSFIDKNNLPPLTFHQLRHTNASLMIAEGIDVVTVSKRLGHSQTSTTVNIYSHAMQKADLAAVDKFDTLIKKI